MRVCLLKLSLLGEARLGFIFSGFPGSAQVTPLRTQPFRVEMFANMIKGQLPQVFEYFVLVVWFVFSFILTLAQD